MKLLLCLLSVLLIGAAHAGTVTLESTRCSSAYFCTNVANDAGEAINLITYNQQYGRLEVIINGVVWDSGLHALYGIGPVDAPLYNGTSVIYVTVEFAGGQVTGKCIQEGRVCLFQKTPVYITGGTIITP